MLALNAALQGPLAVDTPHNPFRLMEAIVGDPSIQFYWQDVHGKRRLIGHPNKPMRTLHLLFREYLNDGIRLTGRDGYYLRWLRSATAFVERSSPLKNASTHRHNGYFYLVDIWNAYPTVNLERLAALLVYIKNHHHHRDDFSLSMLAHNPSLENDLRQDTLYGPMHRFLALYCSGKYGIGLAVGGPVSPFLFNLYCEVFLDMSLRRVCERHGVCYTRYADDCTFSRQKPVTSEMRKEIRSCFQRAGFMVNHRKSQVLSRTMGTVFVTKVGLREPESVDTTCAILVFPKRKRRRLHGIIGSYLSFQMDWPEKVSGLIAEFLYYYKNVSVRTATDHKTFALCKEFEAAWIKVRRNR